MTIIAGSVEEAAEILAKRSERTGQKFRVVEERRSQEEHPRVLFTLSMDTRIRVCARAKMVLGVLSKVFPEKWLDSPEAHQLQEWRGIRARSLTASRLEQCNTALRASSDICASHPST